VERCGPQSKPPRCSFYLGKDYGARGVGGGAWVAAPEASVDDLRAAYRRVVLHLAADDLTSASPEEMMPIVGERIAALVDATLDAALALARRDIDSEARVPFAIIAMGKTGARELNYISDVDVIYVAEAGEDGDERSALEKATRLASATASACSGPGTQAPLWTVDANLRPEGRNGALVRTIESYRQYWDKWAQTWEFQALLKARACAGDPRLGRAFEEAAQPYVWSASAREGFVEAARIVVDFAARVSGAQIDRDERKGKGASDHVPVIVDVD